MKICKTGFKKKKEWEVEIVVPCKTMKEWDKINKIADKTDPNSAGAGTGFGERDINWYKKTKQEAEKLSQKLKKNFEKEGMIYHISVIQREEL